jgi:hypothetical protein
LGLFFTIDETDTSNYLWNQFESLQPAPMLLGFQTKFEDHRQVAIREPQPLVRGVRSRTVAKVDSMGLVVRKCGQCWAGKS